MAAASASEPCVATAAGPARATLLDPPKPFGALIFDWDGTLVDSLGTYRRALVRALQPLGVSLDAAWLAEHAGCSNRDLLRALQADFGHRFDLPAVLAADERGYLAGVGSVRAVPAVVAVARRHQGRVPLAVATGGRRALVEATLRATGLARLFDVLVTIEEVDRGKPAPDLFLLAAARLGVLPSACVAYEDSREGLAAAGTAGMRTVDVRACRA